MVVRFALHGALVGRARGRGVGWRRVAAGACALQVARVAADVAASRARAHGFAVGRWRRTFVAASLAVAAVFHY